MFDTIEFFPTKKHRLPMITLPSINNPSENGFSKHCGKRGENASNNFLHV